MAYLYSKRKQLKNEVSFFADRMVLIVLRADVGGLEDYPEIERPENWDSDHDGMPDEWETANGLDPQNPEDRNNIDLSKVGYTNLEMYLNELAGDFR